MQGVGATSAAVIVLRKTTTARIIPPENQNRRVPGVKCFGGGMPIS